MAYTRTYGIHEFEQENSTLISIKLPGRPVENRSIHDFVTGSPLSKTTFHVVRRAIEKNSHEVRAAFLKENPPDSYLSELEAVCAAFYRFLAPHHAPKTYACYDEINGAIIYRGVISEELPGFQSAGTDPLKEEDLEVHRLAERNLFSVLDSLDDRLKQLEDKIHALERQAKKLETHEREHIAKLQVLSSAEIDVLSQQYTQTSREKIMLFDKQCELIKEQHALYDDLLATHQVSKIEFERYRIVKGLAIGLTTSYIFAEDDLHQNNMSKDGKRIDFDMSLWPLLFEFKKNGVIDLAFRKPAKNAMNVTQYDILHFPNLQDVTPFYWPTNPVNIFIESTNTLLKNFVPLSTNAYSQEANAIYKKLEKNPVFIYHKFAILLKYILTKSDMYRHIAQLYLRKECQFQSRRMIDIIVQTQEERIQHFKDRLLSLTEFAEFMEQHGEMLSQRILSEFTDENAQYQQKIGQLNEEIAKLKIDKKKLMQELAVPEISVEPFQLQIIDEYKDKLTEEHEKQLQQWRQEKKLQWDALEENSRKLERLTKEIGWKEKLRTAYARQEIDTCYVKSRFRFSFSGRRKSIPMSYTAVKDKVIQAMDHYVNPGFWSFGGVRRTKVLLAESIKKYCHDLNPTPSDAFANKVAIESVKSKLEASKEGLTGAMLITLTELLKDDIWKIEEEVVSTKTFC